MATHNDLGRLAEQGAAAWLESKGYELLASNFRYKHAEIDLIMTHAGLLIFIEVKFRTGIGFGFAEEFVDSTKAADHYLYEKDWHKDIRFDIVAVLQDQQGILHYRQFEDAFY
jgi:putative endonuclease